MTGLTSEHYYAATPEVELHKDDIGYVIVPYIFLRMVEAHLGSSSA